jgi:predicted PurR-regulated permease PerM
MSAQKKNDGHSFTSLRIIGERAQRLLARAREMRQSPSVKKNDAKLPPAEEHVEVVVHLSVRSVVKAAFTILAIGFGVYVASFVIDTLVLFFLAVFVATVVDPGVQAMRRMGIPRGFAVLLHYFVALFLLLFLLFSLIPIIADQLQQIAIFIGDSVNVFLQDPNISFPFLTQDVNIRLTIFIQNTLQNLSITHFTDALRQLGQNLSTTAQGSLIFAAHIAGSVVNFFVSLIIVLVVAFFLQLEKERIIEWIRGFLPWQYRAYADDKSEAIQWKLAQWARGQLLLCLCIGTLVFLALTILRMPYALTLAILAGFTEFIPVIGPFIAAVPAVLIAMTQEGFFWALIVAAVYYVIQWCENNLIVPLIMKRAVGLSSVAIIIAMLIGVSFPDVIHPVLGIMLSIPVTTILALFLEDIRASRTSRKV